MGWTGVYLQGVERIENVDKFIVEEFSSLKVKRIERKRGEYYIAYTSNTGGTECMVVITERHGGELRFKDMHEECGPYYYGASQKLINMLAPTYDPYALNWRETCLKENNKVKVII